MTGKQYYASLKSPGMACKGIGRKKKAKKKKKKT